MSVLIVKVLNPCEPSKNEKEILEWTGKTLDSYVDGRLPVLAGLSHVVAVNGHVIKVNFDQVMIHDGDIIAVSAAMEFTAASAIATWAMSGTFASLIAAGAYTSAAIWVGIAAVSLFAIGAGLNYVMGLVAPESSALTSDSSYDKSDPVYSWGDLSQTVIEGTPIYDIYGTNLLYGQVLNQYIDIKNNKEVLYVLMGLCGHQVDSITNVRINNQPYTYFKDVMIETRLGTLNDALIEGFENVHLQKSVKAKLTYNTPITRTTNGTLVEKLKFIVTAPGGMFYSNDQAGLDSRSASFNIEYKKSSDSTWTIHGTFTISGATNEALREIYDTPDLEASDYDMRLTRTTADDTEVRTQTEIYWMFWDEIIKEPFIYPGIAKYAFMGIATEDLSGSAPTFSCLATRSTVQVFDESLATPEWVAKSATNLAWICYDKLVSRLGPERILFDEFQEFADYNDTDVSASEDPAEKRNIANMIFSGGNLWDNIQKAAAIGQAAIIYRGSDFGVFIDKQEVNVAHIFNMGNILDETMNLGYLPEEDRANCIEIEYTDPGREYTRQPISVHSAEYLESTSVSKTAHVKIEAGIPQKQAVREGVRLINTNKYFLRTPSFDAFIDSFGCVTGDLCYFQHDIVNFDGWNAGSRLLGAGNDYRVDVLELEHDPEDIIPWVQLDQAVIIEASSTYKVRVRLGDDSQVEKTVSMDPATTDILFLASPWISMPYRYDLYLFGLVTSGFLKKYRIAEISRRDDFTSSLILAEYIDEIHTENSDYVIEEPTWEQHKQEAISVMANEFLAHASDGGYQSKINVSWYRAYTDTGASWNVWLKNVTQDSDPVHLAYVHALQYTITAPLILGNEYQVIIAAGDNGPVLKTSNFESVTILGKQAHPGDVTNFTATWDAIKRAVHFNFTGVNDIDLDLYEIREGSTWESGTVVKTSIETNCSIYVSEGVFDTKTYRIRAKDKSRLYSTNEVVDAVAIDTSECALAIPGALALVSNSSIAFDGRNVVTLLATWNADSEVSDDWSNYEIQLEDMANNRKSNFSTTDREYQWELVPNKQYGVAVRAWDTGQNHTSYCTQVLRTTARDTAAPSAPTWPVSGAAIPGFKVIGLSWDKNTEYDFKHYLLERSTVADFSSNVIELGEIKATFHSDSYDMAVSVEYFYRLKAVDTSNNESGYSSIVSATTLQVGSTDIAYNSIIAEHLTAFSISADKINALSLSSIIANFGIVTAGIARSSILNSSGVPILEIDLDAGKVSIADDTQRTVMESGSLTHYKTFGGVEIPYKSLIRAPHGTAAHGDLVEVGYFSSRPTIGLAPFNNKTYSAANSSVDQGFKFDYLDLREIDPVTKLSSPGSQYWAFDLSCQLVSEAGNGVQAVGVSESETSDAAMITIDINDSANLTTPDNCIAVDILMDIKSIRGTGTSGVYYNRQVTLKLYIDNALETTKVVTTSLTGQLGFVRESIAASELTAGELDIKVTAEFSNSSGTFGSASYEYDDDEATSSPGATYYSQGNINPYFSGGNINFPQPTTTGWTVYQVDYSVSVSYILKNSSSGNSPTVRMIADSDSWTKQNTTGLGNNTLSASDTWTFTTATLLPGDNDFYALSDCRDGGTNATLNVNTISVTAYLRRYPSGSTTPDNELKVIEYTYDLASGTVIANGSAHWDATGP